MARPERVSVRRKVPLADAYPPGTLEQVASHLVTAVVAQRNGRYAAERNIYVTYEEVLVDPNVPPPDDGGTPSAGRLAA